MKLKIVLRNDPGEKIYRLFRIVWHNKSAHNGGYMSAKLSLALSTGLLRHRLFQVKKDWDKIRIYLFGVRISFKKSYSGYFV